MVSIKLGSLNARGLNTPQKRSQILYGMHKQGVKILFLQETHIKTGHTPLLRDRYFKTWFHSTNQESHSKGVSIAIHRSLPHVVLGEEVDEAGISKSLDAVTGQLGSTIGAKLTSIEGSLKENITKMFKSKNITDTIGRAVADVLHAPIYTAYREAFQNTLLPAFEKGCQSMFQQINSSFKEGTQEYMQQLELHLKTKKANEQEIRDPLVTQLQQLIESLHSTTDQLSSNLTGNVRTEVQQQLHIAVANMQDTILSQVQRIIKEEVNHAMKEQQAAVTSSIMYAMRSAAGTPIPSSHLDYQSQQTHIMQLLQQGQLNQAFQQALTASDLNLILYVCETVDSQHVFGQHPCPLTQPVLLSLIQQLSFDLCTRTELKLNYLEEAVVQLDNSDPVTRDHMGSIINQVRQKLFQFLQVEPQTSLQKSARRLMIMLQGLVTSGN